MYFKLYEYMNRSLTFQNVDEIILQCSNLSMAQESFQNKRKKDSLFFPLSFQNPPPMLKLVARENYRPLVVATYYKSFIILVGIRLWATRNTDIYSCILNSTNTWIDPSHSKMLKSFSHATTWAWLKKVSKTKEKRTLSSFLYLFKILHQC